MRGRKAHFSCENVNKARPRGPARIWLKCHGLYIGRCLKVARKGKKMIN
jgi:hypothetical protein